MRRLIEVTDNWQGAVLLVLFKTTKGIKQPRKMTMNSVAGGSWE
jgi:hypothetical protein